MFESIRSYLPLEWRAPFEFLAAPLWWIPAWQSALLDFTTPVGPLAVAIATGVVLLLPTSLLVVGVWSTLLGMYTVPFRSDRRAFVKGILLAWWDAGRSAWLFWMGILSFGVLLVGWVWGLLRLAWRLVVGGAKEIVASPMRFADWSSRSYFQPGLPWLAFLLTLGWSALEATVFTFTLAPTLREVLIGITGLVPSAGLMLPLLWLFLFCLIAGSFACLFVLSEAIRSRSVGQILQMGFVELFVMFFEVAFLYRELIDAITPWIAQQTAGEVQLGLWSTLVMASFGWMGVRGMTWFLFGRYGTPAILAVLSRESMAGGRKGQLEVEAAQGTTAWAGAVKALRSHAEWLREEAKRAVEVVTLPVLQMLAAAINFPVVILEAEPIFRLPLTSMEEALASTPFPRRNPGGRGEREDSSVLAPAGGGKGGSGR